MRVVGLMSGTSYDGIDVAVAELSRRDETVVLRPLGHAEYPHSTEVRDLIAGILPPATTSIAEVCRLDTLLGQAFAAAAVRGIAEVADGRADLVVSHGQTVFHWVEDGRARGSLQLGEPAWIAERTGLPVLSDLRNRDIAKGGQGAPLVPIFDALLLPPAEHPRAALNLGGIANMTVITPNVPVSRVFAYDLGPGNALIDAAARRFFDEPFDEGGRYAQQGTVHEALLQMLLDEPYYLQNAPKSTGKELFHGEYLEPRLARVPGISAYDVMATVTELTARVVVDEARKYDVAEVIVSGGGVRNDNLIGRIRRLGQSSERFMVRTIDEIGIPSDAKEAYAFALMGYFTVHGMPVTMPGCTGAKAASIVGSLSPGDEPFSCPDPWRDAPNVLRVETREDRKA